MEQRLNCKIVQDLLPNYIEGLTSDITNQAIKEHLSTCDDCRIILDTMTKATKEIKAVPHKQINFLKKIKRRQWMIAIYSVFLSVIILLGAYFLFGSRDFPVPSSNVTISDVYQMSDGTIHYSISAKVQNYVSTVTSYNNGDTEINRIYENRRLTSDENGSLVSLPERWSPVKHANTSNVTTGIYYEGTGKSDRIIIWEKGMSIPKATDDQEAKYKEYLEKKNK
ncbi:zf-HC2 domain-containing protein [Brevibacillus reuszeri]|uniref:zf-HC2 domain-containing protein n=1 Tax=Brevibacillus reuszeri TaxID=54915 RepID=UPI000CCBE569|nr:zf-HC2 domain-containing protein [Brevibacillus reuszeri]